MNMVDIIIAAFLALNTFFGLRTGLVKSLLSLAGLAAGVLVAWLYYRPLAGRLDFISPPQLAGIVAFILILAAVLAVAALLTWLVERALAAVMLGWLNYAGGALLGLLFGAGFCFVFLAVWLKYLEFLGLNPAIRGSYLAMALLNLFPPLLERLPGQLGTLRQLFL